MALHKLVLSSVTVSKSNQNSQVHPSRLSVSLSLHPLFAVPILANIVRSFVYSLVRCCRLIIQIIQVASSSRTGGRLTETAIKRRHAESVWASSLAHLHRRCTTYCEFLSTAPFLRNLFQWSFRRRQTSG